MPKLYTYEARLAGRRQTALKDVYKECKVDPFVRELVFSKKLTDRPGSQNKDEALDTVFCRG